MGAHGKLWEQGWNRFIRRKDTVSYWLDDGMERFCRTVPGFLSCI